MLPVPWTYRPRLLRRAGKQTCPFSAGRKADGYIVLLGLYIVPVVDSSAGWLALPVTTL